MFRNTATPAAEPPVPVEVPPAELIPLSHLSLDLSTPVTGWSAFLTVRNIAIVSDDVGRDSITKADARTLIAEKHENERRAQEVAKQNEQRMIEADRVHRAQIWGGLHWAEIPDGVLPVQAMTQAAHDAQPKRLSPLQEALAGESMTYHPIPQDEE